MRESYSNPAQEIKHVGDVFEYLSLPLVLGEGRAWPKSWTFDKLISYGLVEAGGGYDRLTDAGIRFRNRLLTAGDLEFRRKTFWTVESGNA